MKKFLVTIICFVMLSTVFAGCGKSGAKDKPKEKTNTEKSVNQNKKQGNQETEKKDEKKDETKDEKVTGEIYDVGKYTVLVPEGWKAFQVQNMNKEGEIDQTRINIYKGAKEESDMFYNPGMLITYYGKGVENNIDSLKSVYEDTKDMEPIKIGEYNWKGFTGKMSGNGILIMSNEEEERFQISIWTEVEGKTAGLQDTDVKALIESINLK